MLLAGYPGHIFKNHYRRLHRCDIQEYAIDNIGPVIPSAQLQPGRGEWLAWEPCDIDVASLDHHFGDILSFTLELLHLELVV